MVPVAPIEPGIQRNPLVRSPSMKIAAQSLKVTKRGVLTLRVQCSEAPCSGKLKLTAVVKRKGKSAVVTLGSTSFTNLTVGTAKLYIKVRAGSKLLKPHASTLRATATVTYRSGSGVRTARGTMKLIGS